MIPRTLVPRDLPPQAFVNGAEAGLRATSLDARQLLPAGLVATPLADEEPIPTHVPLEVLGRRTLVPRDLPVAPLQGADGTAMRPRRSVIPEEARPAPPVAAAPLDPAHLPSVVDPDVITTGEVHLLARPVEMKAPVWQPRASVPSLLIHALLIALILLQPRLFPYRPPTAEQLEIARRSLGFVFLPPAPEETLQPPPTSAQIHIDPRLFRRELPPVEEPPAVPGPPPAERSSPSRELPPAPTPRLEEHPPGERARDDSGREMARVDTPKTEGRGLVLPSPSLSPGRALEESLRGALQGRRGGSETFSDRMPGGPGGADGSGQGLLGGTVELLTPTEGVDFTNYLERLLARVRHNWYAVIPESARLGEKGVVVLQFRILRDGSVPPPEPNLLRTSGQEPLDRAALSSVRGSAPFEPLPAPFSGPFIELRFIYLYNLRLEDLR